MIVSAARAEHAPALASVLSDWIDAPPWMPRLHSREQDAAFVARLIDRSTARCLRAPDPVGFIVWEAEEIPALYIDPDARRQGGGRALLADAKAAQDRLTLWAFQSNTPARAFYAAEGFAELRRTDGDNDEGLPDILLEWTR